MIAVILCLAQDLDFHHDGTKLGLKPFEINMCWRLWWHICLLDVWSCEDHGSVPIINDHFYDAKLLMNTNNDNISPASRDLPVEGIGFTDMTSSLMRHELTIVYCQLMRVPTGDKSRIS